MFAFIVKRLLQSIPVLILVSVMTFIMIHSAPGGPFDKDRNVSPEVLKNLNAFYHLDQPLWKQYVIYLSGVIRGDLGPSFKFPSHSVNDLLSAGFSATAELTLYALVFAVVFGLTAGVYAALRSNSWRDYFSMSIAMVGICLPSFVLGPLLLLIFGIHLHWLPVAGWGQIPGDKLLPSLTLGAAYAAYVARISRGSMLDVLSQDYIRTARAKGLSETRVVCVHALRGAIAPVISFLGPAVAGLLAGAFVVETIFQIPGLGRFYVQAAFNRDYTMILGFTLFFACLIVIFNIISDVILVYLNPRLRHQISGTT